MMADDATTTQFSKQGRKRLLRVKKPFHKKGSNRRVSCKDLGNGDCEGWLWKKRENQGFISRDWKKYWFTLKDKSLYYYKAKDDDMAQGILYMPAFIVSPACDKVSSKKFAFKATHAQHGAFLFASERKEDMVKWMNMLQVACLPDFNPKQLKSIESVSDDYSGSENEEDDSISSPLLPLSPSSPSSAAGAMASGDSDSIASSEAASFIEVNAVSPSVEIEIHFESDETTKRDSNVDSEATPSDVDQAKALSILIGSTLRTTGRTIFERSMRRKSNKDKLEKLYTHLASLQRTLKDKRHQLNIMEEFLNRSDPITSDDLRLFQQLPLAAEIQSRQQEKEKEDEQEMKDTEKEEAELKEEGKRPIETTCA